MDDYACRSQTWQVLADASHVSIANWTPTSARTSSLIVTPAVPQKFGVASLFLTAVNSPSLTVTLTAYNGAAVVGTQVVSLTSASGHQQVRRAVCAACIASFGMLAHHIPYVARLPADPSWPGWNTK